MKSAIELKESLLNKTVESVLPPDVLQLRRSIEASIKEVETSVKQVDAKLTAVLEKLESVEGRVHGLSEAIEGITPCLEYAIRAGNLQSRQELGISLVNIASSLLGRPVCINDSHTGYTDDESEKLPALGNASMPATLPPNHDPRASSINGPVSLHANVITAHEDFHGTAFQLHKKHKLVIDIYDEWYGTGDFFDSLGGVNGRNKRYKCSWRKHIHAKTYSRHKQCMEAVKNYAQQKKLKEREAANELQPLFTACNCSITGFVNRCFEVGYLEKKKSRGKTVQKEESR